jgi:hypothetical protein
MGTPCFGLEKSDKPIHQNMQIQGRLLNRYFARFDLA